MKTNTLKYDVEKLCTAFKNFRKQYPQWSWAKISQKLKESEKIFDFGTSASNIEGFFGIGGKRSRLTKYMNEEAYIINYKHQIQIIKEVNIYCNPKIAFQNDIPLFENKDKFKFESYNLNQKEPDFKKDVFDVYYWAHGDTLGKGILTLFKGNNNKANFEIIYKEKTNNLELEGNYFIVMGIVTIQLHDKLQKDQNPRTQIVFQSNQTSDKDCYFGTFSTTHRGSNRFPVGGQMLLFQTPKAYQNVDKNLIESLANYYLDKQRFRVYSSGFDFIKKNKQLSTDNKIINTFFEIRKFKGIYLGEFINPKTKTYETCIIKINDSACVEIMLEANLHTSPFVGIVRILGNKNLIISYDYLKDIKDYRMKFIFNISRYHFAPNQRLLGLICGLEYQSQEPISSMISMVLKNTKKTKLSDFHKEVKVIDLTDKKQFLEFENITTTNRSHDFFIGKTNEDFCSIAMINKIINKNL